MDETTQNKIGDGTKDILLFQFGPVQEFIAQARSTRDLWSGSFMLSWLVAHAIKAVLDQGNIKYTDMIMPTLGEKENPLVFALMDRKSPIHPELALIPNLPNRFSILVPTGEGKSHAEAAQEAIDKELNSMGEAVWKWLQEKHGAKSEWKARWDAQIAAFPQITYAIRPWAKDEPFATAYDAVNEALAARRNTREFAQWKADDKVDANNVKDSLSGKEECIGNREFWQELRKTGARLFKTQGHVYGAMNLIKRLWVHVESEVDDADYLADALAFYDRDVRAGLRVDSTQDIAKRNKDPKVPYVAVLAFDGDHMGELVDEQKGKGPEGIRDISAALSDFALNRVPGIVGQYGGYLIYAGGDDVLAILPSSKAIECAREIRTAFTEIGGFHLDGSCGIAVGHIKAPLQMLVKEAQRMEGVAKHAYGRQALAIALYKRSGEIIEWGTKWDDDGKALDLMKEVTEKTDAKLLSGRFPYALAALLAPYDLDSFKNGISGETEWNEFKMVVQREVLHVLERQGAGLGKEARETFMKNAIDSYLFSDAIKKRPGDFIKLFLAETFLNRNRGEN